MTAQEIRELDTQIIDKVMGWDQPFLPFSTDMTAAMQVVEAVRKRGIWLRIAANPDGTHDRVFGAYQIIGQRENELQADFGAEAETLADLPAAICRCALAALCCDPQPDGKGEGE